MSTAPFTLDATLGAMFVGVVVAATLLGVSGVQALIYFTQYPNDLWYIKLLVGVVLVCDTIHQALISHTLYAYTILNYDDPSQLGNLVWSLLVEVLFNGFTALLVQSFLTMRVWRLSDRNVPLTITVLLLVFGEFGCLIAYVAQSLKFRSFVELATLKHLSISVNALAAVGDVLIAGVLCMVLHRSRTGFQRSDTMINKLIIFAVNTGLLTSVCAVASLISIVIAGNTFIYICFFFTLGRLYSNSLLATLNARKSIRAAAENTDNVSLSLKDLSKVVPSMSVSRNGSQLPTQISIKITNTEEYTRDYGPCHEAEDDGYDKGEHDCQQSVDEHGLPMMERDLGHPDGGVRV